MTVPSQLLVLLAQKPDLTLNEAKLILEGYIYCVKGKVVIINLNNKVANVPQFEKCLTIACSYFLSL